MASAAREQHVGTPAAASFRLGLRHAFPIVLGYLTVGFSYGVVAQQAGLSALEALLMSLLVFAGASQFAAAGMLAQAAGTAAIVGTTFLVNLRHLLFSAALAPRLREKRASRLAPVAFWLTDEVFAIAQARLATVPAPVPYVLGLEALAYSSWALASLAGAFSGAALSGIGEFGLEYALPAMFIAILAVQIGKGWRREVAVALVAGALSLALKLAGLGRVNVLLAALAGAALGVVMESWSGRRS